MLFTKALAAFLLLPGLFALTVPWFIAILDPWQAGGYKIGFYLSAFGAILLLSCAWSFYKAGKGTLAPWSPPSNLVTDGLYSYSRNPMYIAVLIIILGLAWAYASPLAMLYFVVIGTLFNWRVVNYEEKVLSRSFPTQWKDYIGVVPRWLLRP